MASPAALSIWCLFFCFLFISSAASPTLQHGPPASTLPETQSLYRPLHTDFSDYIWPTDAGRIITSVFAEYRSTHFHGGIDISTGDDTGYRVFASRDGYVARIIVGPSGYGKMIWLRHADGYYTTYAHLRNFNGTIEAFVRKEQLRLERYPVIIDCKQADFPVKKGDLIAYTGETGTGSPHLHFEIRDENKNFVNPLLCKQFTFQDDSLPRFFRVAATPLGELSLVNNSFRSHLIEFKAPRSGSITLPETLSALGTFGFAVDVRDRINGSRFKNGVYSHTVFLDDSLIYSVRFDRAPSSDDFQIGLFYDFDLISDEGGKIAKLYQDTPNKLPFYQPRKLNAGIINTSKYSQGIHRFKIVSTDFAGHSSEVSGMVMFSHPLVSGFVVNDSTLKSALARRTPRPQFRFFAKRMKQFHWKELLTPIEPSSLSKIFGPYDIVKIQQEQNYGAFPQFYFPKKKSLPKASSQLTYEIKPEYVRILLRTDGAFTSTPSVNVIEGVNSRQIEVVPLDYNLYTATLRPLESFSGKRDVTVVCETNGRWQTLNASFNLYPITPGKSSQIALDDGKLQIIADSLSVYKPLFLDVQKLSGNESFRYSLLPRYTVLDRGVRVKMKGNLKQPKQAIYFRRSGSRWTLQPTKREGDFLVSDLQRTLGDITLLADTKAPSISRLTLPKSNKIQPHVVSFVVRDNLSGVEYKEVKLYIDGVFAIPEIDGEHRRVKHQFDEPLKRGSHTLRILLTDRVGNAAEMRRTFTVR